MPKYSPITLRVLEKIRTNEETGCWEWTGSTTRGGYAHTKQPLSRSVIRLNRAVLEGSQGDIPDGMFACHTCDNPLCINPAHLFAGTPKENVQDMIAKGRNVVNEGPYDGGKTTIADRDVIRAEYAAGVDQATLAERYGVKQTRISQIVRGRHAQRSYRKHHDPETIAEVKRLRESGATQTEIGRAVGLAQSTIGRILARLKQ